MDNNFEKPTTELSPEEKTKKGERVVTLLLEETIENLSKEEQTPEKIKEIQGYQDKLAAHLKKLDEKYAVNQDEHFDKAMGADPTDRATRRGF